MVQVGGGRSQADVGLVDLIHRIPERWHPYRYGSPRVREALRAEYRRRVSHKNVARLMRENGLNARRRRKFIRTTDSRHILPVCQNILSQQFHAGQDGQKWVSDITYLRTGGGWDMETVHTAIPAGEIACANGRPLWK